MHIHSIPTGIFQTNCYLLSNEAKQCLIVDPGDEADVLDRYLEREGLTVIGFPTTHGHIDHVSNLAEMHRRHPAPIGLHTLDARWAFTDSNAFPPYYPAPEAPSEIARDYDEGQQWDDGGMVYQVLFVPGHSPGSVAFYFEAEGVLIAGDTLFKGSIGRLDLPGGNESDMIKTLAKLLELPDDTKVYPGHGEATTIGAERKHNPFIHQYGLA